jgi:hypothetical protein
MRMMRPMRPERGALAGLLVLALIAAAGVSFAVGVREALPRDFLESGPFADVSAEDIELDPETGLPIVPTTERTEPVWWTVVEPNERIDASLRYASPTPPGDGEPGAAGVSLLATFADHSSALAVAQELAAAVGDPPAEAAWLEAAGVAPGSGFSWQGPEDSATPFVQVIDRKLVVDGLEPGAEDDPADSEATTEGPTYRSPLALALDASAASLLAEGDRGGAGAITLEAICTGDPARLTTLGQELADYVPGSGMRPPWIGPPLTFEEQRARRTTRLLSTLGSAGFVRDMARSGSTEGLPGALADALDLDVVAAAPEATPVPTDALLVRDGGATYEVLVDGRRLRLMLGTWSGVAQGLGPLIDHLAAGGCENLRVGLRDLDDVRVEPRTDASIGS